MQPNPILKKLGYADTDRLVILHTDDIGMCQASVQAFIDLWEAGGISSGAIMMPCPWAKEAANYCRDHPGVDMGVHATLTAEWTSYRWSPLSSRDPATGLMDADGFMWRASEETQTHAEAEAVSAEVDVQVRQAQEWGVDLTHVDSHMGTIIHPKFLPAYLRAAAQAKVPAMLPRTDEAAMIHMGMDGETAAQMSAFLAQMEEQGLPLIDGLAMLPLDQPEGQLEIAKKMLSEIPAGITHFLFHPSIDTPELRAICPDWPSRVANYQTFMNPEMREFIRSQGIQVIGYGRLRDLVRAG